MALDFPTGVSTGATYTYNEPSSVTKTVARIVTYTFTSDSESWLGPLITTTALATPTPSQVSASPAFASGTGTLEDPYVLTSSTTERIGGSVYSPQKITISNQVS